MSIILALGFLLRLNILESIFLGLIAADTSTSIAFKLSQGKIDDKDRELILSVSSLEDVLSFLALAAISASREIGSLIINLPLATVSSLVLGYFISRYLIRPTLNFSNETIILSAIAAVFLFNLISSELNIPNTYGSFLLGLSAALTLKNTAKITNLLMPIRELSLIFFFIVAGSYLEIGYSLLIFLPISLLLIIVKYLSFSIATWITGSEFLRAFRLGLFMTPISEFGIVISLDAINQGFNILPVFDISTLVVTISSTVSSIIINFEKRILKEISKIYFKSAFLQNVDKVVKSNSFLSRSQFNFGYIKPIMITLGIITSLYTVLVLLKAYLPFLLGFTAPLITAFSIIFILLLWKDSVEKVNSKREIKEILTILSIMLSIPLSLILISILVSFLGFSFISILALFISILILLFLYRRIERIVRDIENII
jgi:Kef-type K+ transport system membrane component KefB